jgi:2-aminoadipate transaminase
MSPEIVFDPYTRLYSEASALAKSSEVRDLMSVIGRADIISFAGGLPLIGGIPLEEVCGVMDGVLKDGYAEALQYGETEGRDTLKERIIEVMAEEGIEAEPEHLLVTTGSQQALDLLGRIFVNPGDTIIMEGPTYVGALSAFRPNGPRMIAVPLDREGMQTDLLEEELSRLAASPPKFIYVVPTFQNPAGVTMSARRRERLLALAEAHDVLIIEDNPYGLLRFEGTPVKPLAAHDTRHVVYLGTLSKIVGPGIRVGWVLAPPSIIDKLVKLKQGADLCSSALNQMFAEVYLGRGLARKNVENLKPVYRLRRDAMLKALEKNFPAGAGWTHPEGGLFIWVTLPDYLDTAKMLPLAIDQKVAYVPGSAFYPDATGANQLRLNFSFPPEQSIAEGIKRLGKVIKREIELYHSLGLDRSTGRPPREGG